MKPYGHSRIDLRNCDMGCCPGKSGKHRKCRKVNDRANKKSARQMHAKTILLEAQQVNSVEPQISL